MCMILFFVAVCACLADFYEIEALGFSVRIASLLVQSKCGHRDFAFFVFERTKHQPRRNLCSCLVLQRLCNEAALNPGIDAFWY